MDEEATSLKSEILSSLIRIIFTAIIAGLILFILYKQNWSFIVNHISIWGIPEYALLKEYLSTILSWPIITLILVLTFLYKFPVSISKFLENSHPKTPITEPNDSQAEKTEKNIIKPLVEDQQLKIASQENNDQNSTLRDSSALDQYEFAYLNLYLVWETKIALASFFSSPYKQFDFINSYPLSKTTANPEVEKTAMLQALIENGLIKIDKITRNINVTEKGERFLKILGIIPKELKGWSTPRD